MGFLSKLFGSKEEEIYYSPDRLAGGKATDTYFDLLNELEEWQSKKKYSKMLECCSKSLQYLPAFVTHAVKESGSFIICSIPG